jgi:hypothetical protein
MTTKIVWHDGLTGVHLRGRVFADAYLGAATEITDVRTRRPPPQAIVERTAGQMSGTPTHNRELIIKQSQ